MADRPFYKYRKKERKGAEKAIIKKYKKRANWMPFQLALLVWLPRSANHSLFRRTSSPRHTAKKSLFFCLLLGLIQLQFSCIFQMQKEKQKKSQLKSFCMKYSTGSQYFFNHGLIFRVYGETGKFDILFHTCILLQGVAIDC